MGWVNTLRPRRKDSRPNENWLFWMLFGPFRVMRFINGCATQLEYHLFYTRPHFAPPEAFYTPEISAEQKYNTNSVFWGSFVGGLLSRGFCRGASVAGSSVWRLLSRGAFVVWAYVWGNFVGAFFPGALVVSRA